MEKRSLIFIYISILLIISAFSVAYATEDIEKIIFKERKIEGKIRRPQLVLIKAEQRPEFSSIIMQGVGSSFNITEFGTESIIEKSPYSGAFQFNGTDISNYEP